MGGQAQASPRVMPGLSDTNGGNVRRNGVHRRPRQRMTTFEMRFNTAVELQKQQIHLQRQTLKKLDLIANLLLSNNGLRRADDRPSTKIHSINPSIICFTYTQLSSLPKYQFAHAVFLTNISDREYDIHQNVDLRAQTSCKSTLCLLSLYRL